MSLKPYEQVYVEALKFIFVLIIMLLFVISQLRGLSAFQNEQDKESGVQPLQERKSTMRAARRHSFHNVILKMRQRTD